MQPRTTDFFKAGGTLHPNSPSYVRRQADDELFQHTMAGQFCYVLTSRQRGKSSLMIRTAERLRQEDRRIAIVDLSGLGTQVTRDQWYLGIIKRLASDLQLAVEPEQWWRDRSALGSVQCFTDFLHDVALAAITERMVIFIDEIDSTLKLDFADDFFAAIRVLYNLRASSPEYERLTFVLLGVAAPSDLIKDRNRTPFNIGWSIDVQEFNREDARPLEDGLEHIYPGRGRDILDRVFYWTSGHPYMTQKLCLEIVESMERDWTDAAIDRLVDQLFLAEDARKEDNLQFVSSSVAASAERRQLLHMYRHIYEGRVVTEDDRSPIQNRLRLIGLVGTTSGQLQVSNQIYRHVFNLSWIKETMPANRAWIVTSLALGLSALSLIALLLLLQVQRTQKIEGYKSSFRSFTVADTKMRILAELCQIDQVEAQKLFFEQDVNKQQAMLHKVNTPYAAKDQGTVNQCLFPPPLKGTPQ